jgi:N-methylhydantoinase B
VLVESRALRRDSCGAGKFRGGLGIDMRVRNLVDGHWNFEQTRRAQCPPWGLWGGTAGEPGGYLLRLPEETDFRPMAGARIPVSVGASAIVRTGGGGGWGDPLERETNKVVEDVREGMISAEAARDLYGVVLDDGFCLDPEATKELRRTMQVKRNADWTKR